MSRPGLESACLVLAACLSLCVVPALARGADAAAESPGGPLGAQDEAADANDPKNANAKLTELTSELRRLADQYGPDSVALQAKLLLRAGVAGALGPIEVKVAGPSARLGSEYLEVVVDTGLFFDQAQGTAQQRADQVWSGVAEPALEEMTSFDLRPAGLEVIFLYRVQDLSGSPTARIDPSVGGRTERLAIALDRSLLASLARDETVGIALRGAVRFDTSEPVQ